MQNRTKPWMLFTAAGVFYTWYLASSILLNCTTWSYTLHGIQWRIFAFFTHFFLDLELFYALQIVFLPIVFIIYTIVVLVTYKPFTKAQKIVFGLLPAIAILGNLIAMEVGAQMSR